MGKPEIRFKGYTDEWEQRKLEECLSEITYGFTNPMSDTEEGPWKITAKDILDGMINYSSARHTSQIEYDDLTNKSKPLVGDLLLTKDGTLGRTAIVDAENVCINQSVALLRFNEKCSVQYAKTLLDTPMYQKQMLDDAGGGTIKHIYITKVDKMFISVPCMKEQERLVLFFNNLDNLITLHQRKCDEVKSLKKYMLQKMFPQNEQKVPEIRFEGFTEAWEQRKLGELVGIYDGVHQTPDYQDSGIMFLSVENITTLKSEKYISEEAFERDYKVYPEKGDILMTRIGDVGTTNVVETAEKVAFYVSLALLKPNGIDSYFLSNAMKTNAFQKGLRERTLVTAIPQKINKDEIGKIDIVITNNDEEQKKIGAYFSNLDHLITLHQQKCEELKKIKKFMLQKMFV